MKKHEPFNLEICLKMANDLIRESTKRDLEPWEIELLRCLWQNTMPKEITHYLDFKFDYSDRHFNLYQNLVSKLLRDLSAALGEDINENTFKDAFRREWERINKADLN